MATDDKESLRADLVRLLAEKVSNIDETIHPDESLIASGRVNSLALFEVALWIEERSPEPIDFTRVDITRAWDSIDSILEFVDQQGRK